DDTIAARHCPPQIGTPAYVAHQPLDICRTSTQHLAKQSFVIAQFHYAWARPTDQQLPDDPCSDKPATAGHQNFHHEASMSLIRKRTVEICRLLRRPGKFSSVYGQCGPRNERRVSNSEPNNRFCYLHCGSNPLHGRAFFNRAEVAII